MRKQGLCFLHNQINSSNKFTWRNSRTRFM
jgi:hypothetical protein